ncbi:MAG: NAD(P)H-hydrate dehydratase [Actinomycetota bacterium]|nr:NAD(P)H-hydrate dehydratase [Actinomycetota bacterium]
MEMKAAEEGHNAEELMQRAGEAVADAILRRFPDARSFAAVCGGGANGGDGRIAAELLRSAGWEERSLGEADVVVDALFGTGFKPPPRDEAAAQIRAMNEAARPIVAVDIASGVDASTGEVPGEAVDATVTVTFHGRKVGHEVAPGRFHAGEVEVADIRLVHRHTEHALVTPEIVRLVPRRSPGDTKYTAGSVLVVGGSPGMTGAVCLTAEAAFRADAGYVAVAAPPESLPVIETRLLEAVKRPLDDVWDLVERASALAVGPGLGPGRNDLVHRLLKDTDLPAVIDADGLRELRPFEREAPTVLTPHSGELGRLLGEGASWVDAHRLEALRRAVDGFRCVVILKGEGTLVGAPGEGALVAGGAAPLATAGTGDVLTGIVAAFLAKGMEARLAAAAAVRVHTDAVAASGRRSGLMASDLLDALPRVLDA